MKKILEKNPSKKKKISRFIVYYLDVNIFCSFFLFAENFAAARESSKC